METGKPQRQRNSEKWIVKSEKKKCHYSSLFTLHSSLLGVSVVNKRPLCRQLFGSTNISRSKKIQLVTLCLFPVIIAIGSSIRAFDKNISAAESQQNSPDNCVVCHQKNNDETVKLFANSTHSRRSISCKECHGGDATTA